MEYEGKGMTIVGMLMVLACAVLLVLIVRTFLGDGEPDPDNSSEASV